MTLGQNLYISGWCVECQLTAQGVEAALVHLVEQIGMDTGGLGAQVWRFPLGNGKGGSGVTAVQPLVESFSLGCIPAGTVVGDTWTDHDHCFFVVASCKPFDTREISDWLRMYIGKVVSCGRFDLRGVSDY